MRLGFLLVALTVLLCSTQQKTSVAQDAAQQPIAGPPEVATPGSGGQNAAQPDSDQDAVVAQTKPNSCMLCHGESDLWEGDKRKLYVTDHDLANDIHWQLGLRCHDCHGGDPVSTQFATVHSVEAGFKSLKSKADQPEFCGRCHSNIDFMRKYQPSPRTDQESEYWTSGHGQRLKDHNDQDVASCVSCHGHHGILRVDDPQSPVYPTQVAKTCSTCHSNSELMDNRQYHGKPLGHKQYELWSQSVHAKALLEKDDLSAATCNDCHGNHGAVPPEVSSVANACGSCHVKVANLFANTQMKHQFERQDLPGCATCHGSHEIHSPTDEMLGMQTSAVCTKCHNDGKFGATWTGAEVAKTIREKLDNLKQQIADSKSKVEEAERLGMEVRGPRFDLRKAEMALTNARTQIHSFALEPTNQTLEEGLQITADVQASAEDALDEYTYRRIWLAVTTLPILLVVVILILYIRVLPIPDTRPPASS
jgi:predicted CXXCH cytochrome family protein